MIEQNTTKTKIEDIVYCPIAKVVMEDPVIASDGYTYERAVITAWINAHHTSPMIPSMQLTIAALIPNRAVRDMVEIYKAQEASAESSAPAASLPLPRSSEDRPVVVAASHFFAPIPVVIPLPTKEAIYEKLAACFGEYDREGLSNVGNGSIVEQTFVSMAGIEEDQRDAIFGASPDGDRAKSLFFLSLSAENAIALRTYYDANYPNFIFAHTLPEAHQRWSASEHRFIVNTRLLYDQLADVWGCYYLRKQLLETLQEDFRVMNGGDETVIEQALVKMAGITHAQRHNIIFHQVGDSCRMENTQMHFYFNLPEEKIELFRGFYDEKFPGLILDIFSRQYDLDEEENRIQIKMNTIILHDKVLPALRDFQNSLPPDLSYRSCGY